VFAGYWLLPARWRNSFLLLASYYFYFSYNPWFLLLLIGTSVLDFYLARAISNSNDQKKRKALLVFSLVSNIGVLFIFKYFIFVYNSLGTLLNTDFLILNYLIIPAGLSFYTFQSMSYAIDVYRNKYKATDTLQEFLLFVSFFPHMVAGPIMRHNDLMPQLKSRHYFKTIDWESFAKLTIWGFFKKMAIADNIAAIVDPVFHDVSHFSGSTLLFSGFLFVIQVYADFSGYSDIATGVAKLFGINLSLNWKRPLLSSSLHQFWRRWHISLTTWFRDYLYVGLGGNRASYGRWLFNIFIVFFLSGLWHGSSFPVILWGTLHGVFYILEIIFLPKIRQNRFIKILGWFYLISIHTLTLTVFRAKSMHDVGIIFSNLFTRFNPEAFIPEITGVNDLFFIALCVCFIALLFLKELNEEFSILQSTKGYQSVYKPAFYMVILAGLFLLGNFNTNPFFYFQF
jgi:D-alanyl-lipoteichoic acid acyltransferase DltB (MBOAT superfamily)